jgi:hypothetical protein
VRGNFGREVRSADRGCDLALRRVSEPTRARTLVTVYGPSAIVASMELRKVSASRYVTPLREGGSLPAIIEGDDDGMYVLKFSGAGQGTKALVAELICGELARALGLPVPELVFVELDVELARTEPDPEIQSLIRASAGLNIGLDYLPGSVMFDPIVEQPDALLASAIVWFDAYVSNVDRTPRNANLLMWHRKLQLIDHGAALYFHHSWTDPLARAGDRFALVKDHVLLKFASRLVEVDALLPAKLTSERVRAIVALVPDAWLTGDSTLGSPAAYREIYVEYLLRRLESPRAFVQEAIHARSLCV